MLDPTCLAPHAVARWCAATPDAIALQHVDGDRRTYAELDAEGRAWASALAGTGVEAGAHVATMLPNVFDAQRAMVGLGWLRAVEVPINAAATGRLLAYSLAHADVTFLLVHPDYCETVASVLPEVPQVRTVVVTGAVPPGFAAPSGVRVLGRDELLAGGDADASFDGPAYRDIHALMFTSGTTGPSKAVITPWAVMYQFWSWVPDDTIGVGDGLYCAMPLFHNSGRGAFNYAMARGSRFVTRDRFSAQQFWGDVRAGACVAAALVGPMTALLYGAPPAPDDADNPLRSVILGPMIPETLDFERRFGVRVATGYGQTETGMAVTTGWDHGPAWTCGRRREDYPWPEVRIVDEHDEPVAVGEVGELVVRSAEPWSLNAGYYKMPEATVEAWRNGWFHTGDAFREDVDGWFTFVDRMRDTIRRRGENISSFEVETLVGEHPDVLECAAVGVPAPLGEDDLLIVVIVRDRAKFDPAALRADLSSTMPRYMVPRYIEVVDDLPRTDASMRVRKHELRARGIGPGTYDADAR